MKLADLLLDIRNLALDNKISEPYMVGGVPRDRILGRIGDKTEIKDVDMTTGDEYSKSLAILVAKKYPSAQFMEYDDGHSSVDVFGVHLDFSSHFIIPGIEQTLKTLGVSLTEMNKEIYSRDFTMNTVLESLDFSKTMDITKEGIGDIHAGLIRCPVDPDITIGSDARRILRAIKFAVKFDFTIENGLKESMLSHRKSLSLLPKKFVSSRIDEIIRLDSDKGLDMLIEYNILPLAELSKMVYDLLIQKRKLIKVL